MPRKIDAQQLTLDDWARRQREGRSLQETAQLSTSRSVPDASHETGPSNEHASDCSVVPGRLQSPSPEDAPAKLEPAGAGPLLTTREAACLLRVHPRTIQRLVERGELEAVHLGAAVRFDPRDVAELTTRLKRRAARGKSWNPSVVRAGATAHVSFAERRRSSHHEYRAGQA
jgi:excisionase family DNA binding protein